MYIVHHENVVSHYFIFLNQIEVSFSVYVQYLTIRLINRSFRIWVYPFWIFFNLLYFCVVSYKQLFKYVVTLILILNKFYSWSCPWFNVLIMLVHYSLSELSRLLVVTLNNVRVSSSMFLHIIYLLINIRC